MFLYSIINYTFELHNAFHAFSLNYFVFLSLSWYFSPVFLVDIGCGYGTRVYRWHSHTDDGQTPQGVLANWLNHSGPDEQGLYKIYIVFFFFFYTVILHCYQLAENYQNILPSFFWQFQILMIVYNYYYFNYQPTDGTV